MCERGPENIVDTMNKIKTLNWPLVVGLGALALIRPLDRIIEDQAEITHHPATSVLITVGISVAWILIVGFSRIREPLLTLVFTGLSYGVLSLLLSAVLSPILIGHLDGPLANPAGLVPALAVNAIWGLLCGVLALGLQRIRHRDAVRS